MPDSVGVECDGEGGMRVGSYRWFEPRLPSLRLLCKRLLLMCLLDMSMSFCGILVLLLILFLDDHSSVQLYIYMVV